jgi:probable tRNA-dihydrouridine synthase 2
MIGRGVFSDPFCFRKSKADAENHKEELLALLNYHLDLFDSYQPTLGRPFETLKRFFKIYIRDFDGAKELREKLMHTTTTDEVRHLLEKV